MLNRLNGWERIGVVLSALWILCMLVVGAFGIMSLQSGHGPFIKSHPGTFRTVEGKSAYCTAPAPPSDVTKDTFTLAEAYGCAPGALVEGTPDRQVPVTPASHQFMWAFFLLALLAPLVIAWLLSYILVAVVQWVASGFRRRAT